MRKALLPMMLLLTACATTDHERWRMINDDGVALFAKGAYHEALDSFDYALAMNAENPVLYYNIAQCHERLGNARQAEQFFTACLQRDPKHGDARLSLITMKYRAGNLVEANQMIKDWMTQDPKSADPLVADAWRLRQERNYPLAQGRLQEALSREIDNRRALTELAILDELQNMPDRAYVQYERILEKDPGQFEIRERLELLKTKGVKRPTPN